MTDQRLSELLRERVAELATADLAAEAWRRAERTHRRRTAGIVVGSVAGVVIVAGGVVLTTGGERHPNPEPAPPPATETLVTDSPPTFTVPDATYGGAGVWKGPTPAEEATLPWSEDSSLPRRIDLSGDVPAPTDLSSALAVFGVPAPGGGLARVMLLAPDGSARTLDVGHLVDARDENGNAGALLAPGLSPGGQTIGFNQNSSIELYDVATGQWSTLDTPDWVAETSAWIDDDTFVVPDRLGGRAGTAYAADRTSRGRAALPASMAPLMPQDHLYWAAVGGPGGRAAGGLLGAVNVPGTGWASAEGLVVRRDEQAFALAFVPPHGGGRGKGCCPVVAWLDDHHVAYMSNSRTGVRLLAWKVGTHDVYRVAEFNQPAGGSWARLY